MKKGLSLIELVIICAMIFVVAGFLAPLFVESKDTKQDYVTEYIDRDYDI